MSYESTNGEKCVTCYAEGKGTFLMQRVNGGFGACCPNCNGTESVPEDYEFCGTCGYDHSYDMDDPTKAAEIKKAHNLTVIK